MNIYMTILFGFMSVACVALAIIILRQYLVKKRELRMSKVDFEVIMVLSRSQFLDESAIVSMLKAMSFDFTDDEVYASLCRLHKKGKVDIISIIEEEYKQGHPFHLWSPKAKFQREYLQYKKIEGTPSSYADLST